MKYIYGILIAILVMTTLREFDVSEFLIGWLSCIAYTITRDLSGILMSKDGH